nr:hypothetical protein [Tanacetum cinerariifolium]
RGPSHAALSASQIPGGRGGRPGAGRQRGRVPRRPAGAPGAGAGARPGPVLRRSAGGRPPGRCQPSGRAYSGWPAQAIASSRARD